MVLLIPPTVCFPVNLRARFDIIIMYYNSFPIAVLLLIDFMLFAFLSVSQKPFQDQYSYSVLSIVPPTCPLYMQLVILPTVAEKTTYNQQLNVVSNTK